MGLNLNLFNEPKKEKNDELQMEQNKINNDSEFNLDYMDIDTLINLAEDN